MTRLRRYDIYIHSGILLSLKEEGNSSIWSDLDGLREYYAQLNKPDKDKYCMILLIVASKKQYKWMYMQNRNSET